MLLDVHDLTLHYATPKGPVRAVDGVSFGLEAGGEALGLIGESGSGKTSLGIALMRMLPKNVAQYAGKVLFQGRDLMQLSDSELRYGVRWKQISMVFQGAMNAFNPVIRVGDQVAERMWVEGIGKLEAKKEVERLLERVGLPAEVYSRYPHELSGGMKQRVVIAMALALKPPLVILDEPTSALDVVVQAQIMNLLKDLKRELGLSMLFITHDPALASDLCDRVAVVYGGQIREQASTQALLEQPLDPYTGGLLASIPRLYSDQQPSFLRGAPPNLVNPPKGCRFAERCNRAFEACSQPPQLLEPLPQHQVRCWFYHPEYINQPIPITAPSETQTAAEPSPPKGDSLLKLDNLQVYFKARQVFFGSVAVKALDGVSLELHQGETLAVVGESGSGKTTLGRASLRLTPATGGQIHFLNTDITQASEKALLPFRKQAQAIFQDPYASLSPYMSVFQIVEEALVIHESLSTEQRQQKIYKALEQVRLSPAKEFAAKFPHQLSGGQRQRVGIARTLVLNPQYIVADEPVSMIDASSRAEILYLLRELQRQNNLSFLFVTHDLASARHFADRIAVMYLGRIVEMGMSKEIIENPQHPYTKALLLAVPEPDAANRLKNRPIIQGEPPNPAKVPTGCAFHPRCPVAIAGVCEQVRPELEPKTPAHLTACHLPTKG